MSASPDADAQTVREDNPRPGVRRVILARPKQRNAQNPQLLYELDAALAAAALDDTVKVIILAADGPDFSSGHDLQSEFGLSGAPVATMEGGFDAEGIERYYAFECEAFLGLCRRWRELPKPTIAVAPLGSITTWCAGIAA